MCVYIEIRACPASAALGEIPEVDARCAGRAQQKQSVCTYIYIYNIESLGGEPSQVLPKQRRSVN